MECENIGLQKQLMWNTTTVDCGLRRQLIVVTTDCEDSTRGFQRQWIEKTEDCKGTKTADCEDSICELQRQWIMKTAGCEDTKIVNCDDSGL